MVMHDLRMTGETVLITGGAGFIGSHLAHALLDAGADVRVLDDLSGGDRENVPAGSTFIHGDLLDEALLGESVAGCTLIFHTAAMVSVPQSVAEPDRCVAINLTGTQRLIEHARGAGVRRIIFASSAAVYGDEPTLPSTEDDRIDPRSPYAATKISGEHLLRAASSCFDISTVSLRYFNIFGPRQNPHSPYAAAIAAFADALTNNRPPTIYGDGRQTRDFTPVANVVRANLLAATTPAVLRGEAFNIGTGDAVTLLEVIDVMKRVIGTTVDPVFEDARAGDVRHSCADITAAREAFGYEPIVTFDAGIESLLA